MGPHGRGRRERLPALLRHCARPCQPHPRPPRCRPRGARGPACDRPRPRGRVDQLAPARGPQPVRPGAAHRVPRDHRGGRSRGHRQRARDRPRSRRRPGEPAHRRPPGGIHGVARPVATGPDGPERRPRPERRRAPRGRAGGGAQALPHPAPTGTWRRESRRRTARSRRGSIGSAAPGWQAAATSTT